MNDDRLVPADVAQDAPNAIVDEGVPDQWPPIVDPQRLIATLWRQLGEARNRLQQARDVIVAQGDEINAIETELGVNPSGARPTVAARLIAIEARLAALETP